MSILSETLKSILKRRGNNIEDQLMQLGIEIPYTLEDAINQELAEHIREAVISINRGMFLNPALTKTAKKYEYEIYLDGIERENIITKAKYLLEDKMEAEKKLMEHQRNKENIIIKHYCKGSADSCNMKITALIAELRYLEYQQVGEKHEI